MAGTEARMMVVASAPCEIRYLELSGVFGTEMGGKDRQKVQSCLPFPRLSSHFICHCTFMQGSLHLHVRVRKEHRS